MRKDIFQLRPTNLLFIRLTKTLVTQNTHGWTVLHLQCIANDLNLDVFHNSYNKSKELLFFGKIF